MKRRTVVDLMSVAALLFALFPNGAAAQQDWPSRPMTMIVPLAAGAGPDVLARLLAPGLSDRLGQPVVVENVPGASGMVGASRVAKAPPDGYLFVLGIQGTHAVNQLIYEKPLYDAAADFTPVGLIAEAPTVLIARKDLPANNLREFIAYAKANQAKMQYGSSGVGTAAHLSCALLNSTIGVEVTHVPYRGSPASLQDLMAGRIDYLCNVASVAAAQIEASQVKAIAILKSEIGRAHV